MAYPLYGAYRPACGYDSWGYSNCNNWNRPAAWAYDRPAALAYDRPWGRYNTWDRPWGYNNFNTYRPWNSANWNNSRPWGWNQAAWDQPQDVNVINIINKLSSQSNAESNSDSRAVV